ncbi:YidC/Oxa1 family membrane protein insertase [uncultured Helicobacter sp.]|uniref:YidC/Oxa1 family membrane protein insertase n=1 Tax=uncultured Helicobacter sp. TaxID=175537 RepID=UPI00374EDBE2
MIETLYYIFIYPMQTLLGALFEWLYGITHSYGWSIILLSLLINVFLLKLTNLSESKARAISVLKAACDTKIAEFKKVFKGAELHAYTQTLFKQKHYHPIYNLTSLGGLALQIPFFLGVLFLLQDFEGLEGAHFGIIGDLSKPDTLLFGYALLPFVMSILSLVNVFVSSQELGARIQGGLIALIFLVLLYAMPSGLVLYWTMSMVFWLVKTLWKKRSVLRDKSGNLHSDFRSFASSKLPQSSLDNPLFSSQTLERNTSPRHANSDSVARSESSCTDSVKITESKHAKDFEPHTQSNSKIFDEKCGLQGKHEGSYLSGNDPKCFSPLPHLSQKAELPRARVNARSILYNIFTPYKDLDSKAYLTYRNISIFALLNIFFLIFVFSPFAVYSSDVSQFDPSQTFQTLGGLFGFFLLFSFLGIYITSFFYKTRLLKLGVFACIVLVLIAISYVFFFTGNIFNGRPYAPLDGLLFKDGGANISHPFAKYFDVGYALFLMLIAIFVLYKLKNVVRVMLFFMFSVIVISGILDLGSVIIDHSKYAQAESPTQDSKDNTPTPTIPDYTKDYLGFSKDKQNIIVLMSDTVQSDNFTQALKDYPEFYDVFEGFTYYTNTLSASSITFASFPAIIGGEYYAPYNVNKRELKHTLAEENSKAIVDVANSFSNAGYAVSFGTIFPGDEVYIRPHLKKDVLLIPKTDHSAWVGFYKQHYHIKEPSLDSNIPFGELVSLGFFRASPYIFRARLYQAEGWLFGDSLLSNHFRYSVNNASKIASFAVLSNTDSPKPTFKLFHELTEHFPWLLDKDSACQHITDPSFYRSKLMSDKAGLAYSNHICYVKNLASWLKWFKDSGIYDNTKIIIVSDHGNGGLGAPLVDLPRRELRNSHIFFMVKDFNAKGKLKIDSTTFVSNSDAMAVACDEIDSKCPKIPPSFLKNPMPNRELIFTFVDGGSGRQTNTKFDVILQYRVKNSIFDLSNWIDITNTESKER